MNNIASNFDQIIQMARKTSAPVTKKRGIIREFLQVRVIEILSGFDETKHLSFVGGTSLRLIRGIDRFSEDLDFDNLGLTVKKVAGLVEKIKDRLGRENISVDLKVNQQNERVFVEFRFPELLYQTRISSNPKEKLMIKFDSAKIWRGQKPEVVKMNQYGYLARVLTNPIDQLLVQKLKAYVDRSQTQARDVYDVVWLYGKGARFDKEFAKQNGQSRLVTQAKKKWKKEGVSRGMRLRLRPFLFIEQNVKKLEMLGEVLNELA